MLTNLAAGRSRSLYRVCQPCLRRFLTLSSRVNRLHDWKGGPRKVQENWRSREQERPGHPSPPRPRSAPGFGQDKVPLSADAFRPPPLATARDVVHLLRERLTDYVNSERFEEKLKDYGLSGRVMKNLINVWHLDTLAVLGRATDVKTSKVVLAAGDWDEENLIRAFSSDSKGDSSGFAIAAEAAIHRKFVEFCSTHPSLPTPLQLHLQAILKATDLSNHALDTVHTPARSMTRNFHLHIGPTNSGKTYNALKALAGAESGIYAGPLRLLAHEVWERLNLGTVGGLDGQGKPCNLFTGEERRIVDGEAKLISCTVEMVPLSGPKGGYDVVVIDEIQMLGDPNRGGAWTRAIMGVCAKEVHLCGDETTLELLETLIPSWGDTLTIHRYERLTPLHVEDESLGGDWSKVQDGDCVVTFSRNNIYAIKKQIEGIAAKKCAVVYGALPPETRADQAKDFNDENGRCKVLVASDAVGMGLNLKIRRIIFESLEKFNGKAEVPLLLTQVKQIAGRAGRFGMQRKKEQENPDDPDEDPVRPDEEPAPGGGVTTLHKADLPILKAILPMELPKIKRATLDIPSSVRQNLATLLPSGTSYATVLAHTGSLVKYPRHMQGNAIGDVIPTADILQPFYDHLTLQETDMFLLCPMSSRDPNNLAIYKQILKLYTQIGCVTVQEAFSVTRFLTMLDLVEATIATLPPLPPVIGIGRRVLTPPIIITSIPQLETMHKSLVMYIWLSFRLEIAFPERNVATELKLRCEKVLDECLARFPGLRNLKTHERSKEIDGKVALWRREYVAPNGTRKMPGAESKGIKWVTEAVVQRLRNKELWKNTGLIQPGRVLKEADGLNGVQKIPNTIKPKEAVLGLPYEKKALGKRVENRREQRQIESGGEHDGKDRV